uniref:Bacterial surface antigen (D15) domain-containing protein n=1 Tax=Panagrellus redivivus TaxID=6233 RepID=A0A7E4V4Z5_PANRE
MIVDNYHSLNPNPLPKIETLISRPTGDEANFELFGASFNGDKYLGGEMTLGNVGVGVDGFGLRAQATGLQPKVVLGPEPKVGFDAGFTANLTAVEGNVGPVGASIGLSADTGIKIGKEGVGFKLLGTGGSIGRTTSVQLFGIGFSVKLL